MKYRSIFVQPNNIVEDRRGKTATVSTSAAIIVTILAAFVWRVEPRSANLARRRASFSRLSILPSFARTSRRATPGLRALSTQQQPAPRQQVVINSRWNNQLATEGTTKAPNRGRQDGDGGCWNRFTAKTSVVSGKRLPVLCHHSPREHVKQSKRENHPFQTRQRRCFTPPTVSRTFDRNDKRMGTGNGVESSFYGTKVNFTV